MQELTNWSLKLKTPIYLNELELGINAESLLGIENPTVGWYFYSEDYSLYGPYDTKEDAQTALNIYNRTMLGFI